MEALAGFAYYQWLRLEWPDPDAIIPLPDRDSISVALAFSDLLERPFCNALYPTGDTFDLDDERVPEKGELLLFDATNPIEKIEQAVLSVAECFPKRIFVLSLFEYDFCHH